MKHTFLPNTTQQNGVFKYLINRFGSNVKNYIEIHGTNVQNCLLFDIVNDSNAYRYKSDPAVSNNFYLVFRKFSVKITHYAMRNLNNYCFSKEWKIYDSTNNANTLLSHGNFSQCGTGTSCAGNQIQIYETESNPLIRSLKFDQIGTRSDGADAIEFKSMEIYGTLIFDCDCFKTYPITTKTRLSLLCFVLLVY